MTGTPYRSHTDLALRDITHILENDPAVSILVSTDILVGRIRELLRRHISNEIRNGWEAVENVPHLLSVLGLVVDQGVLKEGSSVEDLQEEIQSKLLPVLKTIQLSQESKDEQEIVSGDDVRTTDGLGEVLRGSGCDTEQQAG